MALNYVTITGTFNDGTGSPLNGSATFTPNQTVYAAGIPVVSASNPVNASIVGGSLTSPAGGALRLLATDNAGLTFASQTGFFFWTVQITLAGAPQPSWSFFLPHLPSTVDLFALADTAAAGGFANPMTTLGDLIYEDATPTAVRLPGNTAAARRFLRQTGTGTVSAAPAWDTIQPGDLPLGTGLQAWQFMPETNGALGNGKIIADLVLNGTTTATSATAGFTSADTGKTIMINGGTAANAGPLVTTITFVNATTITLGATAGVSGTGFQAVYGNDDTAAINACITAASNYAQANNYFAEVLFGAKIYMLTSAPTQTGNGTTTPTFNAQIPIPFPNANGTTRKLIIGLTGAGDAGHTQYWESLTPNVTGTALVSTITAPLTPNATFGIQSVIGGPTGGAGFTGSFANVKVSVKNMSVWCGMFTNIYAYDFGFVSQMRVERSSAHCFAPTGVNGGNQPYLSAILTANTIGSGFRTPVQGNNDDSSMMNVSVSGFDCHYRIFDHFVGTALRAIYSDVAVKWDSVQGLSGTGHLLKFDISAEVYNGGFLTNGGTCQVDIDWDCETPVPVYDINDSGNGVFGEIRYGDRVDNRAPIVTGASHARIVNTNLGPGHMASPPAVPATTVATSPVFRDAWVAIHTGAGVTVSVINIDGTATGLTMAASSTVAVRVPIGKTIALTYAGGTPTWDWWLD